MLIAGFPSGSLQANCYLIATGAGADCVVVDPGEDSATEVGTLAADHGLTPVAVLLSHGHFDHVGGAAELCDEYGIPVHIHHADRYMLADPLAAVSAEFAGLLADRTFPPAPATVVGLPGSGFLDLAGVRIEVIHTPGHTPGSTVYGLPAARWPPAGAVHRRHAVRRHDRPQRPAGRRRRGSWSTRSSRSC